MYDLHFLIFFVHIINRNSLQKYNIISFFQLSYYTRYIALEIGRETDILFQYLKLMSGKVMRIGEQQK